METMTRVFGCVAVKNFLINCTSLQKLPRYPFEWVNSSFEESLHGGRAKLNKGGEWFFFNAMIIR